MCSGWNPKNPNFGGVNRRFQAKRAKYWKFHVIETTASILTKFGTTTETTKWSSTVVPVGAQQIQMADGCHFEKNRYITISLRLFDRFWWNLAWWRILAPYIEMTVKISNFWKSKMAAAAILKITKIVISPQRFDRSLRNLVCWCKMGLLTSPTVNKLNFKNPRWQTAAILKTVKSPYLCNLLTDFN